MTLSVCGLVWALVVGLTDVPNPRERNGTWVSDMAGVLDLPTEQALNRLIFKLEVQTGVEIAVVTIPETDGRPPKAFATALFNRWGIGKKGVNNGVLFLVVMSARRIEVEVGDGLAAELPDNDVTAILTSVVVPRFREGNPGAGVKAGVESIVARLTPAAEHTTAAEVQVPAPAPRAPRELVVGAPPPTAGGLRAPRELVVGAPPPTAGGPRAPRFVSAPGSSSNEWGILLLPGVALLGLGGLGLRTWLRYRPRVCTACRVKMVRLQEHQDDRHLDDAERLEEHLGSVDYDVWYCFDCHASRIEAHASWFSRYRACPQCSRRTMSVSDTTVTRATTYGSGQGRRDRACTHCSFADSSTYTIPRLQSSSSSSSRFSGGGSSSFGGGSSSGRGGGASW